MSIKDQIRAEIERLIRMNQTKNGFPAGTNCAIRIETYEHLLSFLDSIPEQPVEGLEEAAENYIAPIENDEGLDYINFNGRDIKDAFIAGAEWMKEKDTRDMYMSDNRHFQIVYELGKKDMKKQMMEEAVEGVAEELYNDGEPQCTVGVGTYFQPGEEVYVIKKEDGK